MTTYRERREARAERLRGWATKREATAEATLARARQMGDGIPFGQPVMGARDRSYRDKIGRTYERAFENAEKAERMASRAAGIESQLATSIYSDDEDAIERLTAKLAELEARRRRITDYNASCRKALKSDPESKFGDLSLLDDQQRADLVSLFQVASYQIRAGGAFPSYATANIGGQISKLRERLARLSKGAAQ